MTTPTPLPIYLDADVLFAGAARRRGASFALLLLGELGIVRTCAAEQATREAERNLLLKAPAALPDLHRTIERALHLLPTPTTDEVAACPAEAHPKDAPHLAAARAARCPWLATFNFGNYWPVAGRPMIVPPGNMAARVRGHVALLSR